MNKNPSLQAAILYDAVALGLKNKKIGRYNFRYRKKLKKFMEHLPKKGSVIDIGCGFGLEAAYLKRKGFLTYGIDVSSESIKIARQVNPNLIFIVDDLLNLEKYKILNPNGIHEHLSLMNLPKRSIKKVLGSIYRILPKGGIFQSSFEIISDNKTGWHRIKTDKNNSIYYYLSFYSLPEIKKVLSSVGFQIIFSSVGREEDKSSDIFTVLCKK
jgi:ubiquinone/menaquinone biosynthesis C-methylase UbiE